MILDLKFIICSLVTADYEDKADLFTYSLHWIFICNFIFCLIIVAVITSSFFIPCYVQCFNMVYLKLFLNKKLNGCAFYFHYGAVGAIFPFFSSVIQMVMFRFSLIFIRYARWWFFRPSGFSTQALKLLFSFNRFSLRLLQGWTAPQIFDDGFSQRFNWPMKQR